MSTNPITIEFVQGDTVNINIQWNDDQGAAVDLTGSTIVADLKKKYTATDVLASFVVTETDLSTGSFILSLSGAVTAAMPPRPNSRVTSFVFDMGITYPNGDIATPIFGYLKMQRQVTL